jgi:hypothetical protein
MMAGRRVALTPCPLTLRLLLVPRPPPPPTTQAALIFSEAVFQGESLLTVPPEPARALTVPLAPPRDAAAVLLIKALVGAKVRAAMGGKEGSAGSPGACRQRPPRWLQGPDPSHQAAAATARILESHPCSPQHRLQGSSLFQVFELEMEVPKFAMYAAVEGPGGAAAGSGVNSVSSSSGGGGGAAGGGDAGGGGGGAAAAAAALAAGRLGSVTFELRAPLRRVAAWVESRWALLAALWGRGTSRTFSAAARPHTAILFPWTLRPPAHPLTPIHPRPPPNPPPAGSAPSPHSSAPTRWRRTSRRCGTGPPSACARAPRPAAAARCRCGGRRPFRAAEGRGAPRAQAFLFAARPKPHAAQPHLTPSPHTLPCRTPPRCPSSRTAGPDGL